jgi:hypothetical protein
MGGKAVAIALAVLAGLAAQGASPNLDVIRVPRSDGGGSVRFDPDRVEKNYRDGGATLKQALSRFERKAVARMEDGYDAGLPDPIRTVRRRWKPSKPLPEPLREAVISVVTLDRNGAIQGLPKAPLRRGDVILVSRAARLRDCARLGRVTLLTRELAARLGIRASRGRCVVSADGAEIEITEGDVP